VNGPLLAMARVLGKVGDGWDAVAAAIRQAPRAVRDALAVRGQRRIALVTTAVVLVLYLASIGDIAVSASGRWAAAPWARFEPGGLWRPRAPYLFEPVLELHPGAHVAVFLSPINTLLGLLVALLVGANIALAVHSARPAVACRRPGYSRVLGALPAFLLGFACCVPTFVLALGASTAAAVLPVLLPLRPVFYPLTLVLLLGALVWGAARLRHPAAASSRSRSMGG